MLPLGGSLGEYSLNDLEEQPVEMGGGKNYGSSFHVIKNVMRFHIMAQVSKFSISSLKTTELFTLCAFVKLYQVVNKHLRHISHKNEKVPISY